MEETKPTAKELGFHPSYKKMDKEQSMMFLQVMMGSPKGEIPDEEAPFILKVLRSRIAALNLPIKFSVKGEVIAMILSDGIPGRMMALLIDCLTRFEGQEVTEEELVDIYPWGFYSDESFADYIDNYIKPRKCKWSDIY